MENLRLLHLVIYQMDPLQQQLAIFHQRAAMCKHLVGLYQIKLDHIQTLRCTITNGQVTTPTSEGVHIGTLALTCVLLMFYTLIFTHPNNNSNGRQLYNNTDASFARVVGGSGTAKMALHATCL